MPGDVSEYVGSVHLFVRKKPSAVEKKRTGFGDWNQPPVNESIPPQGPHGSWTYPTSDFESTSPPGDTDVSSVARWGDIGWCQKLEIGVLALAGAGLVLLSTAKYGVGISPDSVTYLDVARNLASGKGLVFSTGEPLAAWPPLYPILLALIGFTTGLDPSTFAHLVNAVSFALVIILSSPLFLAVPERPRILGILGLCAVLFSISLSPVYAMAWSECIALPLWLLYLVSAQRYWRSRGRWPLLIMALATALSCVTRYLAIALVPAGVLTILLAPGLKFGKRVMRACAFAALSLLPIGFWAVHMLQQRHLGAAVGVDLSHTLQRFWIVWDYDFTSCIVTIFSWYFPRQAWFIVPAGLAATVAAFIFLRPARGRLVGSAKAILRHYSPAVILLVTYVCALLILLAARGQQLEERYLSTVYIPVTLILFELVVRLFGRTAAFPGSRAKKGLVALMVLWLCFPMTEVVLATAGRFKNGAGEFSTKLWHESETLRFARQMLTGINTGSPVYSNGPDVLWELAGVDAVMSPDRRTRNRNGIRERWPAESLGFLVWLKNVDWRSYLFSVEELAQVADVIEVAHFSDGSIYRVSAREAAAIDSSQKAGVMAGQP